MLIKKTLLRAVRVNLVGSGTYQSTESRLLKTTAFYLQIRT